MLCMQHVRGRVACRGGVLGRANGGLFAPSCGGEQVWERLEEDVVRLDDEDVPLVRCQPRGELPAPQGAGTRARVWRGPREGARCPDASTARIEVGRLSTTKPRSSVSYSRRVRVMRPPHPRPHCDAAAPRLGELPRDDGRHHGGEAAVLLRQREAVGEGEQPREAAQVRARVRRLDGRVVVEEDAGLPPLVVAGRGGEEHVVRRAARSARRRVGRTGWSGGREDELWRRRRRRQRR